jgi:multidrug efflux system outer membrane protein
VLFSQRDLLEARRNLIDTKQQQLSAVVNTYQALGGGSGPRWELAPPPGRCPPCADPIHPGTTPASPPPAAVPAAAAP